MVRPYWVGHSSVTSAHFSSTACLGLWLLANVQVDCVFVTAVLILDTSAIKATCYLSLSRPIHSYEREHFLLYLSLFYFLFFVFVRCE